MTTNLVIDVTSIFTSEQFFEEEKTRIAKLAEEAKTALALPITDSTSYRINHETQMKLRDERIKWEKARKDFTSSLDEKKKFAIDRERAITSNIIPYEEELKAKKEAYDKEKERIKAEEEAERMRVFQARYDEMTKYGVTTDLANLRDMSDDGFRMMADTYKEKWEESEKVRIAKEALDKEIADAEEAKRQQELEDMRKWKEEQAKIEENNRIQAEENARKAQEILDKQNAIKYEEELKKAQEKARLDGIEAEKVRAESERLQKEESEKVEKARLEKEESYRKWLSDNGVTENNRDDFKIEKIE
jgi:hypothetical protein